MNVVRPVVVLDCPTAEECLEEWVVPVTEGTPDMPAMEAPGCVVLKELARSIGRDAKHLTGRAKAMGCVVEYRHIVDGNGRRQRTATTNEAGAAALRRWYGC